MVLDLNLTEEDALEKVGEINRKNSFVIAGNSRDPTFFYMSLDALVARFIPRDFADLHEQHVRKPRDVAIENAGQHGGASVSVFEAYSPTALFVVVADNGKGFDAAEAVKKFYDGRRYYHVGGDGFKIMHESKARVGFNEKGNKTLILYEI